MKKIILPAIIIIIIVIISIIAGYAYLAPKENVITSEKTTKDVITQLLSVKLNLPAESLIIAVTTDTGIFAKGTYNQQNAGGGIWLAAKTAKGWELASAGNGIVVCSDISAYNFPKDIISQCLDTQNGNKIINISPGSGTLCTADVKQCPDGSYVGRSGPNCEFASCPPASIAPYDSGVQGTVTLGPTCPVMRVGDTACADKPFSTYIQVIAIGSPKSSLFDTVKSDATGKYKVMLPPGNYSLQPVGGSVLPRCEKKDIIIESSKIVTVDISCDTGIR